MLLVVSICSDDDTRGWLRYMGWWWYIRWWWNMHWWYDTLHDALMNINGMDAAVIHNW